MLFEKGRRILNIRRVHGGTAKAPYIRLLKLIRARIHDADGKVSPEYDFAAHMAI